MPTFPIHAPVVTGTGWPTAAELAVLLQRTLTTAEAAAATQALAEAADVIRDKVRQTIDLVTADAATLHGSWASTLVLPERPVVAVAGVSINGIALVADVDYWWPGLDVVVRGPRPTTLTHDIARGDDWGGPNMAVDVVYSHGYAEIPPILRTINLAAGRRGFDAALLTAGVSAEDTQIGNYKHSVAYSVPAGSIALSDAECRLLRPYRRSLR